jgi:hypothetical protein
VFVADPMLSLPLLREMLSFFDVPIYPQNFDEVYPDQFFIQGNRLTIHASSTGMRDIDLGGIYDVSDLLNPELGLPGQEFISIPMEEGDTRFILIKSDTLEAPAEETDSADELDPPVDQQIELNLDLTPESETGA